MMKLLKSLFAGDATDKQLDEARAALDAGQPARAVQMLDTLLAAKPDEPEAHFLRGTALTDLGRQPDAIAALERAIALRPAEPRYLFNAAVAHWRGGALWGAQKLAERALAADPSFEPARAMLDAVELRGEPYTDLLARLHAHLRPRTYMEIGTDRGTSLELAGDATVAIGVDPEPKHTRVLRPNERIYAMTSDAFFGGPAAREALGGQPLDLGFIDGMHHFEFALRDFIHMERLAHPGATLLVHDCYPLNEAVATRDRNTAFWTGDVWRMLLALARYRPDLRIHTIAAPPSGIALVRGLDPQSTVLADNLDAIVAECMAMPYSVLDADKPGTLRLHPNRWEDVLPLLA